MDRFPEREEDSWFSDAQLGAVARADDGDNLRSPIPTAMVSNGEYMPFAQTTKQKEVEARIADMAATTSKKLNISRRRFLATSGGMAAAPTWATGEASRQSASFSPNAWRMYLG